MAWALADGVSPTTLLTVDSTFKALRQSPRPIEFGAGTHVGVSRRTGTLAAALASSAVIFSFRWGDSILAALLRLKVSFQTLTVWTAHQEVSFEAFIARSFTVAHTGGTAANLGTNSGKKRTSLATSKIATNGDWRIASTAALGGGTIGSLDNDPFAVGIGSPNIVNAAAGTAYSPYNRPEIDYHAFTSDGRHPYVFAVSEGFVVRNAVVWPVAGTGVISIETDHAEVAVY